MVDRRDFLKTAGVAGASLGIARAAFAGRGAKLSSRVIGSNDRINIGFIGVGGRGSDDAKSFQKYAETTNACQVVGVCDVYEKRKRQAAERHKCDGYLDYRELLARSDVDAVVIATPDHWHAKIALDAMDQGKDVYVEKPMCHTNEEIKQLVNTVKETKRVLQVGSQTTSGDQWWKARKAIADGMIGQMILPSQLDRRRMELEDRSRCFARREGRKLHRLEDLARPRAQAVLGCRPILPLPQILGLLRRYCNRSFLSCCRPAQHLLG